VLFRSIEQAFRLYKLALQHSFTKGRRVDQVAAACLYTICRIEGKPFMLIDFSDALQINVFTLGNVFSQLMQLLRMQEHPVINKYACGMIGVDLFRAMLVSPMRQNAVLIQ
jgi:transcription factor IIIB subunit 2